jgi:hypothetical protein
MSASTLQILLFVVLIAGVVLFLRASLKGGRQLGAFWDRREEHKRARESRNP